MIFGSENRTIKIAALLFMLVIFSAFGLFVNVTRLRRLGFSFPPELSLVENSAGFQTVLISTPAHPPWAQAHLIHARTDVIRRKIRIYRYYIIWHPFSESLYVGPSIILADVPTDMDFEIEYWDGNEFVIIGELYSGSKDKGIELSCNGGTKGAE